MPILKAPPALPKNETLQLRLVLSSNQARGRWGEETLRRVVEAAGMSTHCDFSEQTQEGDSKPDLIVRLPGDRFAFDETCTGERRGNSGEFVHRDFLRY